MRVYQCHRCGGNDEYTEWIYDMHLHQCYFYRNGMCGARITGDKKCDATRYVRADVAIRYVRAEARKAYNLAMEYGYSEDENEDGKTDVWYERTFEEAQQAWIKQNRGNVAQREA